MIAGQSGRPPDRHVTLPNVKSTGCFQERQPRTARCGPGRLAVKTGWSAKHPCRTMKNSAGSFKRGFPSYTARSLPVQLFFLNTPVPSTGKNHVGKRFSNHAAQISLAGVSRNQLSVMQEMASDPT